MSSRLLKGVELKKVIDFLKSFAPNSLAEKWDKTGLIVEPMTPQMVKNVLLTIDLTEDVVSEAINLEAGLIVCYHPPVFKPLDTITTSSWKERIIGSCIENKIAIYSPHTSWDSVPGGINDWLASAFEFDSSCPIDANKEVDIENAGIGRYFSLKNEMKISEAVQNIKKLTSLKYLNLALARNSSMDSKINVVAICAGSGNSVLNSASVKADLFLTGEMSHHNLLDANQCGTSVIFCNHSNSERGYLNHFAKKFEAAFSTTDVKVHVSQKDRDPIQVV